MVEARTSIQGKVALFLTVLAYVASIACAFAIRYNRLAIAAWAASRGFGGPQVLFIAVLFVSVAGGGSALTLGTAYWLRREIDRTLTPSRATRTQLPQAVAIVSSFLFALVPFVLANT